MQIVKDKQLIYDVKNYDVVLVPMGLNNSFSNGLRYELNLNFKGLKEKEIDSGYGDRRKFGTIFPIKVGKIAFCMCYMLRGWNKYSGDTDNVDYYHLASCLVKVQERYNGMKIASPLLGVEPWDGNGDKDKIMLAFKEHFDKSDKFTLYDYKQRDYKLEIFHRLAEIHDQFKKKELSQEEYLELRKKIEWERVNGVLTPMPEDYEFVPQRKRIKKAKIQDIDGNN